MSDVPDPLVPADVDLRGYEFMPLYGARMYGSNFNAKVSDAGFRAAVSLWWQAWNQVPASSLPNDDVILTKLADLGRDLKAFSKIKTEALAGFVECSDGRLYHRQLAVWALEAWDRRQEHRETTENKHERQKRWRERCKKLGEDLRALGVTPPKGASLETLEGLLEASTVDANVDVCRDAVGIGKTVKGSEVKRSEANKFKSASVVSQPPEAMPPKVNGAVENTVGQGQKSSRGQDWDDPAYVVATAKALGVDRPIGQSDGEFRDRVYQAVQDKIRDAKRVVTRNATAN